MHQIEQYINKLKETKDFHTKLSKDMIAAYDSALYGLDFLMLAAMNRSRSHTEAFIDLIEKNNYISAVPLIRMQLDSILRLEASMMMENPHDFALSVMGGNPIRKMKDKNGNKLTDAYLLEQCKQDYPWMKSVYTNVSGFIHLSEKHIFGTISSVGENGHIKMQVSATQDFIPDSIKIEAITAFYTTVECIFKLCREWTFTKDNPELAKEIYIQKNT